MTNQTLQCPNKNPPFYVSRQRILKVKLIWTGYVFFATFNTFQKGESCGCSSGWIRYGNSCYQLYTSDKDMQSANEFCKRENASLISIKDSQENNLAKSLLKREAKYEAWIGLKTNDMEKYVNVDGTPRIFREKITGQGVHTGNCVSINNVGYWSKKDCKLTIMYICKKKGDDCSGWTACNSSCNGYQNRTLNFTSPDGQKHSEPSIEMRRCNIENCFSEWSQWSECNETCGIGVRNRTRHYIGQKPMPDKSCNGSITILSHCISPCYNWSRCNMTCGIGFTHCTNPNPQDSDSCTPLVDQCNQTNSDSDAMYTNWSNWSDCTSGCGVNYQRRTRNVTSDPSNRLRNLEYHLETEARECTCLNESCNCSWSNWTDCNVSCGGGVQRRFYNCSSSRMVNCSESFTETRACSNNSCPVDGNFTEWSNWTTCSVSCGNGTQQRMRNCTNPPPANSGKNCTGVKQETRTCNTTLCPIDGNFTEWSNWTTCSVSCGNGTQQRMRNCTNPPPANDGRNCTGNMSEIRMCSTSQPCPDAKVNGNFTEWTNWTACTVKCGTGTQQRTRTCTNPPPANGGAECPVHDNETQNCNTHPCPIDGNWTAWSTWSYCNRPCGTGHEYRTRLCTNPRPQYGGKKCEGNKTRTRECTNNPCPGAEVLVLVRFTAENWTDSLRHLNRTESITLRDKIWDNLKGIYKGQEKSITNITVHYYRNGSVVANFSIWFSTMDSLQLVILQESMQETGLLGKMPVRSKQINATKVPSSSPNITSIKNHTSTSISLSWTPVPPLYLHGKNLKGYSIFYKERSKYYSPNQMKPVSQNETSTIIENLRKYTDYTLRILAFTESGNGISSEPLEFRTDEDVPSKAPPNFKTDVVSPTAIKVYWDHIHPDFIHGILLGYNVTVTNKNSGNKQTYVYGPTELYALVEDLKQFTKYRIQVYGFTSKGSGKKAEDVFETLEDVPSHPPTNAKAFNLSSNSKIKVSWQPAPPESMNGKPNGYTLKYRRKTTSRRHVDDNYVTEILENSVQTYTLTNLVPYTVYEIQIAARTSAGAGPFTRIYGETCRCPKTIKTNYWFLSPYLKKTDGKIQGIFSHIVRNMITSACESCRNGHGKTDVDFSHDGNGAKAEKNSMIDVAANIHYGAQVSFPINGNKDMTNVYGGQTFVPVVQSPGVAFLSLSQDSTAWNILKSVLSTGPLILFSLSLAYLAGISVWYLDSETQGSTFPRPFIKGANEGMWWAFISMTTVGYGDRSPRRISSRLFAILWTLYGMVLISMITSTVTTSLSTLTIKKTEKIYGLQVAAIENSSEHRLGILLNGKVNQHRQYHSVGDIREALVSREVEGALIDTYVVAIEMKRLTDEGIEVTKLLDRPFGYGIALSAGASLIEHDCRDYLKLNQEKITALIERSTGKLKKLEKSGSFKKSSGLFDPSSHLYRNSMMFVGSLLLLAVMCGIVWHYACKNQRANNKVSSSENEEIIRMNIVKKQLKEMVQEFYISFNKKLNVMRERHRKERWLVYRGQKKREKRERKEIEKQNDDDDFNIMFKNALKLIKLK